MRSKAFALMAAATLALTPVLGACGASQVAPTSQAAAVAAPNLNGRWRQVGHAEGEDGMVGAIDGDMIALWFRTDGSDWTYWCGTFEAPQSDASYKWTSHADKANMTGLLSSQDDSKEFSYEGGKISFQVSMRGETTTVTMEQASEEAGLLADLKSGEGKPAQAGEAKPLELVDSAYVVSNGYVHYVLAVANPNEGLAPRSAKVSIVGRAADGSISFSNDWVVGTTLPGSTTYWASQAGNGSASESDTVEIKVSVDDDDWYKTSLGGELYQIGNVSVGEAQFGGVRVTGEITLLQDAELGFGNTTRSPMLVCVLKDANGKLVAGFDSFVTGDLKVGEPTAFEMSSYFDAVQYASAEVYANPWM